MPDQFQYVKLPDGSYGKFAANATDEQIRGAISKDFPDAFQQQPSTMQKVMTGAKDLGIGAARGLANTSEGIGSAEHSLFPQWLRNSSYGKNFEAGLNALQGWAKPENTMQAIGKGAEQVGEFFLPGAAEEEAAAKLGSLAPKIAPLAKVLTGAASTGLVNKAQGGSFAGGAGAGAAGGALGYGLRTLAPKLAESAIGIGKIDRAFGKTPGKAVLEETSGVLPETIAESGKKRIAELTPQLEEAADRASARPNPVRALLPAPAQEIPLAAETRNPRMRPMAFRAEVNPEEPLEPRSGNPMAPISEYPAANPHYLSGSEHPELSGRVPTTQGMLIRPAEVGQGPIPAQLANPSASLAPARGALDQAMSKAARQEASVLHSQIGNMSDFLRQGRVSGEPIPENVTPRRLLDLKRGFAEENLGNWNPETHERAIEAGRNAYRAMDSELDRTVPMAKELNQRISSLIPVVHRAESTARNAPVGQMMMKRIAAPTGGLLGTVFGGEEGYKHGGLPGAIAGAGMGLAAPVLVSTPEGQMVLSRAFDKADTLRPAVAAGLQANRPKGKKDTEGQVP